jgi:hypothetical protein
MLNFDDYKNKLPWPDRPPRPHRSNFPSGRAYGEYEDVTYPELLEKYNLAKRAYNEEIGKLMEQFKEDLFKDLRISDNPKRHKLFQKAWESGHAYGCENVYNKALDLVELIR